MPRAGRGRFLSVAGPDTTSAVLELARTADLELRGRPGYRAELGRWTAGGAKRRDGVPVRAMGPTDRLRTLPVRHFAEALAFPLPSAPFESDPAILVLATAGDTVFDHLRAGQALQRVLLTATSLGLATGLISQPAELAATRARLADAVSSAWPQIVLRVGDGRPVRSTPRRPLEETLLPSGGPAAAPAARAGRSRWSPR
ncbi:hypothetical protein GCM10020358_21400 [Amorphoplanes nipponensis]|uniref:nitroreductase family protein n=1 Tax=Actinoplanes nipponensis TaxID=135950 RepID=UPI0031E577E4